MHAPTLCVSFFSVFLFYFRFILFIFFSKSRMTAKLLCFWIYLVFFCTFFNKTGHTQKNSDELHDKQRWCERREEKKRESETKRRRKKLAKTKPNCEFTRCFFLHIRTKNYLSFLVTENRRTVNVSCFTSHCKVCRNSKPLPPLSLLYHFCLSNSFIEMKRFALKPSESLLFKHSYTENRKRKSFSILIFHMTIFIYFPICVRCFFFY